MPSVDDLLNAAEITEATLTETNDGTSPIVNTEIIDWNNVIRTD